MYDRSSTHRSGSYTYPTFPSNSTPAAKTFSTSQHTSSAFSASANPNEDWTKISDLAERRRIQNRIAQRNYRKKLKKRLEDLERRAGSSSASPEQEHKELPDTELESSIEEPSLSSSPYGAHRQGSGTDHNRRGRTPDILPQQYVLPSDDRGMFSQQFTRQLSTSPPPFSYAAFSTLETPSYTNDSQSATNYCSLTSSGMDMPLYPHYVSNMQAASYLPSAVPNMSSPAIKQEHYASEEMNPFSMSYATIAGVDVSAQQSYQDVAAYVSCKPHHHQPPYPRNYYYFNPPPQ